MGLILVGEKYCRPPFCTFKLEANGMEWDNVALRTREERDNAYSLTPIVVWSSENLGSKQFLPPQDRR